MDDQDKIDAILEWSLDNPEFNPAFVGRIQIHLERYGSLSEKQVEALDNIIDKYEINV